MAFRLYSIYMYVISKFLCRDEDSFLELSMVVYFYIAWFWNVFEQYWYKHVCFFLSPGIFTTKWVWRQFFYSRCGIKQFMNDFCPQKTFMSSIWMSSCFFSIRNHIFQRRIIEREKNLFSRNKSRAHATFFYHFFLNSLFDDSFMCRLQILFVWEIQ